MSFNNKGETEFYPDMDLDDTQWWAASVIDNYGGISGSWRTVGTGQPEDKHFVTWWTQSGRLAGPLTECSSTGDCEKLLPLLGLGDVIVYDYSISGVGWDHAVMVTTPGKKPQVASRGASRHECVNPSPAGYCQCPEIDSATGLCKEGVSWLKDTWECTSGSVYDYYDPNMIVNNEFGFYDNGKPKGLTKIGLLKINYEGYQP